MIAAVIVAAGQGKRFDDKVPKQLHYLSSGRTIVDQTIEAFTSHKSIGRVCVVMQDTVKHVDRVVYTPGGESRQESVRLGLEHLTHFTQPSKVLIHDGVRPFVSHNLISSVIKKLDEYEAVDVAMPITDTVKTHEGIILPRDAIYASQTPQGFDFNVILDLHTQFQGFHCTDDISLYLASGGKCLGIVTGEPENIKITYKSDLK